MKKIILIVCLVIGTAVCAKAQEPLFYHRHGGIEAEQRTTGFSGTGANIDVLYHRVFWRINPDSTKYIRGWVQTNFRTTQASVSSISMDMHAVLIVDSVRFRNSRLPSANITRSGNIVTIALGVTLADNFIDSFTIFYRGVPPAVSGAAQGYQRITSVAGAGNYINTLSESYEDRDWWPCKADMQDKVDSMDITVSVPWGTPTAADTFWVACNGKLVDSTISGGSRFFTFKTRYPIATYLVAINVARYNRYYRSINLNGTIIPVVYNLLQGKTATAYNNILTAMDRMNTLLVAFSQLFGDYPFKLEKHGYYDGLQGAAGMEHQTFSAMSPNSLTSASVLAHELIHQWFGDNVTFATWNELWLAEGFARYGEALAGELVPATGINPTTARSNIKSAALGQTTTGCWIPNSSIANSNLIWGGSYSSTTYNRGAMVISMLRSLCGDAKFYEILTKFQRDLTGKSATTDTLKRFFNEGLGVDLTPFFNDYVGGSGNGVTPVGGIGHPTNTIAWNTPSPNKLVVQVASQTRSSGTNVAYFRGPVVLRVTGLAPGQDTLITFMDWGGGNLSYAGNGISLPVAGNRLSYYLSFTPATVTYDDGARTMTNGSTTFNSSLDGYIWFGTNSTAWNTAGNWRANEVPPSGADITIATTGSNQPILPGSITVGPLNILANNTVILNGHTLTLNNTVRGTGTFTGSPTSNLVVAGAAGTLNFNQATVSSRSLNNLTLNGRSSAALAPGELNVLGALTATGTNLDVRTATVKVGN